VHQTRGRRSRLAISVFVVLFAQPALADEVADGGAEVGRVFAYVEDSERVLLQTRSSRWTTLLTVWQRGQIADRQHPRLRLDLDPLFNEVLRMVRDIGIPLQRYRDPLHTRAIGVTASFRLGEDFPAVSFHVADRAPAALDAFYSGGHGLRWAFVWPVGQFTMRLEGGDRSEFGYLAVAGAQWNHPRLPLAVGLGLPVRLRNAEGEIGVILQLRATLQ